MYKFFVPISFQQLFLATFGLWQKIWTKNAHVKWWWNWPQDTPVEKHCSKSIYIPFIIYSLKSNLQLIWNVLNFIITKHVLWDSVQEKKLSIYCVSFLLLIFLIMKYVAWKSGNGISLYTIIKFLTSKFDTAKNH